ncbi:MAG: hypothetical protein GC162_18435 [Planctomycetes bacterium]|nr:hypothetical protein [Planctomycetota bacterium]
MKLSKMIKTLAFGACIGTGLISNANAGILDVIKSSGDANIVLTYFNRDMGTTYNFNAIGDEDTWGVAYVTVIDANDNGTPDYVFGAGGEFLTIMFHGGHDTSTTLASATVNSVTAPFQITATAGVVMDVYLTTTNPFTAGQFAPNGSADRSGNTYANVTTGTKVLSLTSDSFQTFFNASTSGTGNAFFSVDAGNSDATWASLFDTNKQNGGLSDLHVQFTTNIPAPSDWLVTSNDPARGFIAPLPGAASMGFGLLGLIGLGRKRRAA